MSKNALSSNASTSCTMPQSRTNSWPAEQGDSLIWQMDTNLSQEITHYAPAFSHDYFALMERDLTFGKGDVYRVLLGHLKPGNPKPKHQMRSWRGRRELVAPQPYRKKLTTGKSRYFVKPRVSSQGMIASGYLSTVCSGNDGSSSYPVVDFSNV